MRAKAPVSGPVRPEGSTPEDHRAETGIWGSAVSSTSGVRGGTLAAERFSCILEAPRRPLLELIGPLVRLWGIVSSTPLPALYLCHRQWRVQRWMVGCIPTGIQQLLHVKDIASH